MASLIFILLLRQLMAQIPLSDIQTQVLSRCNMENSQFVSDSEFVFMINSSAAELYEELVAKHEDYFATETYFNLSSDSKHTLPTDFFKVLAVDVEQSDGYFSLKRWIWNERDKYETASSFAYSGSLRYKLTGNTLHIKPDSTALGHNYRLVYIPQYSNAVNLDGYLDSTLATQNWFEYVVVDACIKVLTKQETDPSIFIAQKQQLLTRIQKHAAQRDEGKPIYMADSSGFEDCDIPHRRW